LPLPVPVLHQFLEVLVGNAFISDVQRKSAVVEPGIKADTGWPQPRFFAITRNSPGTFIVNFLADRCEQAGRLMM
jgi:hypothetical protein